MFCNTKPSWQGEGKNLPRCIPHPWRGKGIEPMPAPKNVSPFHHSQGDFALPAPIEQDLENCLSTCTKPCIICCQINHHSGERSCYPQIPHEVEFCAVFDYPKAGGLECFEDFPTMPRRSRLNCGRYDHI